MNISNKAQMLPQKEHINLKRKFKALMHLVSPASAVTSVSETEVNQKKNDIQGQALAMATMLPLLRNDGKRKRLTHGDNVDIENVDILRAAPFTRKEKNDRKPFIVTIDLRK